MRRQKMGGKKIGAKEGVSDSVTLSYFFAPHFFASKFFYSEIFSAIQNPKSKIQNKKTAPKLRAFGALGLRS